MSAPERPQKRGLGLYDLAAAIFVVAMLILLLAPAIQNLGQLRQILIIAGGLSLVALLIAGYAFVSRRRA